MTVNNSNQQEERDAFRWDLQRKSVPVRLMARLNLMTGSSAATAAMATASVCSHASKGGS